MIIGILAVLLVFLWRPGIKQALKRSQEAQEKDWRAVLIPLALVILFVILLISAA
jgi:hypothetical protein